MKIIYSAFESTEDWRVFPFFSHFTGDCLFSKPTTKNVYVSWNFVIFDVNVYRPVYFFSPLPNEIGDCLRLYFSAIKSFATTIKNLSLIWTYILFRSLLEYSVWIRLWNLHEMNNKKLHFFPAYIPGWSFNPKYGNYISFRFIMKFSQQNTFVLWWIKRLPQEECSRKKKEFSFQLVRNGNNKNIYGGGNWNTLSVHNLVDFFTSHIVSLFFALAKLIPVISFATCTLLRSATDFPFFFSFNELFFFLWSKSHPTLSCIWG